VQLGIYNLMGQIVKILVNEQKAAGVHKIQWDGTNEQRQAVVSGVYFCVITAGPNTAKMKVILLR
jgi:flagellar hook assembly protein FlgD